MIDLQVKNPYYSLYRDLALPPRVKVAETTGYEPKFKEEFRKAHGLERATENRWHEVKAVYVSPPRISR